MMHLKYNFTITVLININLLNQTPKILNFLQYFYEVNEL